MSAIELNDDQRAKKQKLQELVRKLANPEVLTNEEIGKFYDLMATTAHELHMSLSPHPRHHRYMTKNRGLSADDPEFYRHIHPVEDLLKYLNDPSANDDPVDQTIGHTFKFRVYTRRWGHDDVYRMKRTSAGWEIHSMGPDKICHKNGSPELFRLLEHDLVNYPKALPDYVEYLWSQAESQGLSAVEVQKALDDLGKWVSICERNSPSGVFRGLK